MKQFSHYLFDLDGTLTDPKTGITKSVQYALQKKGVEVTDLTKLEPFIGPPLHLSFEKFFGFSKDESKDCVALYREYYTETGIYENNLYPFIPELLSLLKKKQKQIHLATSKPTFYAEKILSYFNLTQFFNSITGSNMDLTRTDKKEIISFILDNYIENPKPNEIVMIGDRKFDIIGAKNHGLATIGLQSGYESNNELKNEKPDYLLRDTEKFYKLIKSELS